MAFELGDASLGIAGQVNKFDRLFSAMFVGQDPIVNDQAPHVLDHNQQCRMRFLHNSDPGA